MNDVLAIYVPCFQSTLGSLGHRFQIRAPCPVFALFWYLGWLSIQQIKDRVIEICIKNKDVHLVGILKKCLMVIKILFSRLFIPCYVYARTKHVVEK